MRLITTLSLGVAALALAGAPLYAQNAPAVGAAAAVPFAPAPQAAAQTPPPAAAAGANPAATTVAAATPAPPAVTSNGIVAVINESIVSDYELDQRIAFGIAVNGGAKPTPDEMKIIRENALRALQEEKLQFAEARKMKITVSPVEVNERIDDFLKRNNLTREQVQKVLLEAGTSLDTYRDQMIASLAWQKVLEQTFAGEVVVPPAAIDDAMRRAAEGANKPRYRVSEIFLGVDRPEDEARVKAQMESIEKQIRAGGSFRNLARQYSRNPSAALGGDMGWVYDGQLDPEMNSVVAKLDVGELSAPIRGKGGWYILGVQERQEPLGTDVTPPPPPPSGPPGTLPLARLLLPLPQGAAKDAVDNTMKISMQIRQATDSCATLEKISQDPVLKGSVFMSLGNVELSGLHPELQKALAQTQSGEVAMPIMLDAGVEIFARCDKRPPPPRQVFKLPTREEIQQRLFNEHISALARRHLRDLKREASIQERGRDNPVVDAALVK
jgi:peptidyl-prolyl cis-trans isomerase SurA